MSQKKPRLTPNQSEYQRQVKRIERALQREREAGYLTPSFDLSQPKRITQKKLKELKKITPKMIRQQSDFVHTSGEVLKDFDEKISIESRIIVDNFFDDMNLWPDAIQKMVIPMMSKLLDEQGYNTLAKVLKDRGSRFRDLMAMRNVPSKDKVQMFFSEIVNDLPLGEFEKSQLDDEIESIGWETYEDF